MDYYTTLKRLKTAKACGGRYKHLLGKLGAYYPQGKKILLTDILKHNGVSDTIWAIGNALPKTQQKSALQIALWFGYDCAKRVVPIFEKKYPKDKRVRDCVNVTRRYLQGKATKQEVKTAAYAAADAAYATADAAAYAADAAYAAAKEREIKWQTKRLHDYLTGKRQIQDGDE